MDVGIILWVHMAPRGCFGGVLRSPECDIFSGALVVRKAPWTFLESSTIILDHFWNFQNFGEFCNFGPHFHHILSPAELLLNRMEIESIFYDTLMYFVKLYSPVWSEDP